ncbi:HNH endonuclease signature motif containing protein [Microbispora bryophytorum]|uniref:HNH endonuclease signature motif containing protein n=1 Tax=Microbispora bryophytorum TaxID=1460882 RepID=UPI0033C9CF79
MDLFGLDPERSRRSNSSGEWWDRLTGDSPLWSSEGSLAREHFPIADPQPARHASRTKADSSTDTSADGSAGSGLMGGEETGDDATSAASADSAAAAGGAHGLGAGSARGAGGGGSAGGAGGAGAGRAGGCEAGAGQGRGRSSWVLVGSLRESAQALALAPLPGDADICVAEAEDLLFARDRITCALADRVGRVHGAGQARQHGHASTRSWLRTAAGMSVAGAGRLLTLAVELARLPRVREKFAAGVLSAGVVEAICTATARLSDEHAVLAEPILLELAGKAGPAEVAKAGRYLRAVLDPDGEDRDERADYGRRFLRVRPTAGGGLEGEFYLPREAAARLRALLDAYAKPRAEGDDRPLRVRQVDAFIALMEQKIVAELLVLVNAESLPTDHPEDATPGSDHPEDPAPGPDHAGPDHPEATEDAQYAEDTEDTEDTEDAQGTDSAEDGRDSENAKDAQDAENAGDGQDSEGAENAQGVEGADGAEGGEGAEGGQGAQGADSAGDGCGSEDTGAFGDAGSVDGPCPVEDSDVEDGDPGDAASAASGNLSDADPADVSDAGMTDAAAPAQGEGPYQPRDPGTAEAETAAAPAASPATETDAEAAAEAAAGRTDLDLAATAPRDKESCDPEADEQEACEHEADEHRTREHGACERGTGEHEAGGCGVREQRASDHDTANAAAHAAQWPDPPPEDATAHHTHAGHQPAGNYCHGQGTPEGHNDVHHGWPAAGTARGAAPGAPRPEPGTPPGEPGPRTPPGAPQGRPAGTAPGEPGLGAALGALLGTAPGLLLATGQMLPLASVHRLARTSSLVRLVMDAEGQVLDMGRKVRLATPAQRRAVYARYATCWIDGCPLPATMCQIDHADNWSTGGLTDLKLLGPACQFHNRDRYQHPDRYTRHKTGTDRWTFTYHHQVGARRLRE